MKTSSQQGFTLVEVMIALAILAMGLAVLIKDTANNIAATEGAHMDGVVSELARGQMYEIEERLSKEGFQDTDDHKEGNFDKDGWESVSWAYKIEAVELPELGAVQTMASKELHGAAKGSGSGSGAGGGSDDAAGMFGNSALGGMLGMFGGMGGMGGAGGSGMSAADAKGASFIQSQYELVKSVLKASIRKVTLTVKWNVMNEDRSMVIVEYVTDPAGMNKVLGGLGAEPTDFSQTGAGGGTGSGSSTTTTPRPVVPR